MTSGDQDSDAVAKSAQATYRQPALLLGLLAGLLAASVVCLGFGWLRRTPELPLGEDFSSLTTVLWRTTFVVAGVVVLAALYLAVGRVYRQTSGWRAKFVAYSSPALFVLVVAALMAQSRGTIAKAFRDATEDQLALRPFAITTVAHAAWWFACLALAVLAVLCALAQRNRRPHRPRRPFAVSGWVAAAVAVIVAVALVLPVMAVARKSPFQNETAAPIDPPALTALTGQVAYRAEVSSLATYSRPGGAGWVHVEEGPAYRQETVVGYDGATGERRWTFSVPRFNASELRTTGTGPGSVVLVKAYIPTDVMIALDATTGALLWTRVDHDVFDEDYPLSSSVLLSSKVDPVSGTTWTAFAVRTGDELWSKTFARDCKTSMRAAENFILMNTCGDGADVLAQVLDPQTGQQHGAITAASLGMQPGARATDLTIGATSGDRALVSGAGAPLVIDIASGRVVARLPERHDAVFIDSDSLMLAPASDNHEELQPVSIRDLRDGETVDTGLLWAWHGREQSWGAMARVGDQWLTLLPDAPLAPMRVGSERDPVPMRIIGKSGPTQTLPNPCEGRMQVAPVVSLVPGAVLVECGRSDAVAAVR
ncbi:MULTISPECIES: PQQ-binding-like beta-propeller repeat protein [Mycolicibacterium]|uniref:outer membrane protein assembly factor BamB family protein n=1 Tax=Mycolicibacterium TaxID=1866885 RepID=UPI0014904C59|nr:PQQ-binding-like beta-propeller repeat protein [Mycolicibacterium fortuitum]